MSNTPDMYKKWEFENFLNFIKDKNIGRALIYAKTLGIDRRTLLKWMQRPELAEPLIEAVDALLSEMQRAGKDDWRMYKELYMMLGLDDVKNIDVQSGGEPIKGAIIEFAQKPTDNTSA